ncbi:hypothetical protein SKAU_G00168330 [Synaphobranchus kaupii]|uniref:Uncharacterized protein n=1 Tax=Synaphobranchus kaupii TaxID=118154 RepID=A0A9Q1FJW0_SYNKA|nr:hypothetical protein SKAU_G00168330 [Synaphobranchus kaupii]
MQCDSRDKPARLLDSMSKSLLFYLNLAYFGLQGMPGDYLSHSAPMGMTMGQPSYSHAQMRPHSAQLRHGPPMRAYIPGTPHHPAMLMHSAMPIDFKELDSG